MTLLARNANSVFVFLHIVLRPLETVGCAKSSISTCMQLLSVDVRLQDEHHVWGGDHQIGLATCSNDLGIVCRERGCESQ